MASANHQALHNIHVTLRGKKYDVSNVVTAKDVQLRVQELSGGGMEDLPTTQSQLAILFDGKRLKEDDILCEVGVQEGAQLSLVPATTTTGSTPVAADQTKKIMEDYMKKAGIDESQLDEIMKSMGGGGGSGGSLPSLKESMSMMTDMMKSPLFQQYMSDPEQLEKSRQMILTNPMLKSMMAGMPGMEELLNDPVAWREAMTAAANMYQNMDPDQLMEAMSGVMGGDNSLFDGTLENSAAAARLNELEEDD